MNYQLLEEKDVSGEVSIAETSATVNILVIGTGGGGCNAIDSMIKSGIKGVKFIAINTDIDALRLNSAETKIQIGANTTGGRGAGGMPDCGEQAALEDEGKIREALKGAHMVFIVAGMGGGTGTGSAPVIAKVARSLGALTVGVVTKPFASELGQRMKQAENGILRLREEVDTLIVIPNEKLLEIIDRKTPIKIAFARANDVLSQGVKAISDLITEVGDVNIDFADAQTVMRDQGEALMSIGFGEGESRISDAVAAAIDNPLLEEISINGATRVLIYISAGEDFSMVEYQEACNLITRDVSPDAHVFAGMYLKPEMKDRVKIVVIATGFSVSAKDFPENVLDIAKAGYDTLPTDEYRQLIEKSRKSKSVCLSRRDSGFAEDELDIPSILRYPVYNNNDDCVNSYSMLGKAAN